jgi:1-acyl-sn-glycerol-3-phosphate acyltransferase
MLTYELPLRVRLARHALRPTFRGIFRLISEVRIIGAENIPSSGPYLIAINHVSLFDPPFVLAFWPVAAEAVGAVDIWDRPGQSLLAKTYGGIRVHRGEYDRELIDTILAALAAGRPVVIAPEGGRSHQPGLRRALPGAAFLVEKAQVPVVPVGVVGATDDFLSKGLQGQKPAIEMRIGKPIYLPSIDRQSRDRHLLRQHNSDLIMAAIAQLLPPEYQGVYARTSETTCTPA